MKIERHLFHRKAAKSAETIDLFFFVPQYSGTKKNAHALPAGLEVGQNRLNTKILREACGLSLFCPLNRKGKKLSPRRSLRLKSPQVSAGTGGENRSPQVITKLDTNGKIFGYIDG
jgi:hypothetical protein